MEPIVIQRAGNLLKWKLVVGPDLLDAYLAYQHRYSFRGRELAIRKRFKRLNPASDINPYMEFTLRRLYQIREDYVYCPAGFLAKVVALLGSQGIEWVYEDLRAKLLPQADFDKLLEIPGLEFKYKQDEVLLAIDSNLGGVVVAPTGYGKSFIARMLTKAYYRSNILFISPGVALIRDTYDKLLQVTPDVGRIGDGHYEPDKRVTLCSADSLHKTYMERADLIIYDEVHTSGTDDRAKALSRFTEAKFIGFSASYPGRSDGSDAVVESIFGPIIIQVEYDEAAKAGAVVPLKVLMVGIPPTKETPIITSDFQDKKKVLYWRNDQRNGIIAEQVKLLPELLGEPDPQVLIMVETLEHAYELRKFLPDFQIMYATLEESRKQDFVRRGLAAKDEEMLNDKLRAQMQKDFASGKLRKVISTFTWKQGVDFVSLPVLVRADGGASTINNIQIPGRLSRISSGKEFGVLIDLQDEFCPYTHARAKQRVTSYRRLKWPITAVRAPVSQWP